MDRNKLHHVVEFGSPLWIGMNIFLVTGLFCILFFSRNLSEEKKWKFGQIIASVLLINMLIGHIVGFATDTWSIRDSLPLHLCSFSVILVAIAMFTKKQMPYEFLIFWGAGAVHSFLTPEMTIGGGVDTVYNTYRTIEYSVSHFGIICGGLFLTMRLNRIPNKKSWLRVFLYTQLTLPIIGFINWGLGSNYMYISQRPEADSPMIIGEWPYYIIGLEVVIIIHFIVFYYLHKAISPVKNIKE